MEYSSWKRKALTTTTLRLDDTNPRLSESDKTPTQPEIIDYLIINEKIFELAKDIANQGFLPNESPIVCKEGTKYVVLEGNRRVSACKILINPDLVKSSVKKKQLLKLQKKIDLNTILKLDTFIAPSREEADVLIMNRHSGGAVVERWDKTKQDRFLYRRFKGGESIDVLSNKFGITKSDLKKAFMRHNVYEFVSELPLDEMIHNQVKDETKFSVTNLERTYESSYGANFLGIEFSEEGDIIKKLPKEELEKRWSKITIDLVEGKINSRVLNTEKDKENYFKSLESSGNYNLSIELDNIHNVTYPKKEEPVEEQPPQPKPKPVKTSNTKLFPTTVRLETGFERIDAIFWEIRSLNIKNHPNAISVLLRSYLDMLTYQFLKKKGEISSIKSEEGKSVSEQNDKKIEGIKKYFTSLGVDEETIDIEKLKKSAKLSGNLKGDWIPSLYRMLGVIASSNTLIEDDKMRQALKSYMGKDPNFIGHNEFNLLVHNEYYTADAEELRNIWTKLFPILEYFANTIKK